MTPRVLFLPGPDFDVLDEVLKLIDTKKSCRDLSSYIGSIADKISNEITGQEFRRFRGPSGAIYPSYITDDEPYVVYAVINRLPEPQIQVLKAGLRNGRSSPQFFPAIGAEVEHRVASQGWSLCP